MAEDMLFSGESKNIEYKVIVPDKSEKYMKTVVAFANGRGGKIVFGIDDKTLDIVGMDVFVVFGVSRVFISGIVSFYTCVDVCGKSLAAFHGNLYKGTF